MIFFSSESVKHDFYTKLSADKQLHIAELYKALVHSGYRLTVTEVSLEEDGRVRMSLTLVDYYK